MIAGQTLDAVRLDAGQVRFQQDLGDLLAFGLGEAVALKDFYTEGFDVFMGKMPVCHGNLPFGCTLSGTDSAQPPFI